MVLQDGDRREGILAFEVHHAKPTWLRSDPGTVRIAGQIIAAALGRKRAAVERADLEQRLDPARRLEAVGTFASGTARNVNNVVGAVIGHVEMASGTTMPGSSTACHLRETKRAGDRAQEPVASILQFGTRLLVSWLSPDELGEQVAPILNLVRAR